MIDLSKVIALNKIAKAMVAPPKGVLAADESDKTIAKRFESVGVESTEANRITYREMFLATPRMEEFISGVILYDETIRQNGSDGRPFVKILQDKGVIPGIKVDKGTNSFNGSSEEKITKGLEGLPERLKEYYEMGARFGKWRAVITIGENIPTKDCIAENAQRLAQYASDCQNAGIVPIVEPEVLMDGSHTIERCEEVTLETLTEVFRQLKEKGVELSGMVLKPNMVLPGKECSVQANSKQVAEATLRVFKQAVPKEVPGIAFLSGGQSDEEATENLNEINKIPGSPWELSFSYGRALQMTALKTWKGKPENIKQAQAEFYKRARLTSLARIGLYDLSMERE